MRFEFATIGLTNFVLGLSACMTVDLAEAAFCGAANGQVINVSRPCGTDNFEMPVASPPALTQIYKVQMPMPPTMPMPMPPQPAMPVPPPALSQDRGTPPPPSSICIVPNMGTCAWPGGVVGSQCNCSDGMSNSYAGIAH
jgi:hypothetical protein